MGDLANAYVQIIPSAEGISGALQKIFDPEASKAGKSGGDKFSGGFLGVLGKAGKIGAAAIGAATTAVAAFGKMSVSAGMEFDSAMSQVAATMGLTMSEMETQVGSTILTMDGQTQEFSGTLREFAMLMGQKTAFSATQAADALNYMALAGYDVNQSMEMLPNVLNLAAAGSIDLARASDMITDASTAFGLSVEENGPRITQMVDEMAKAASTGNTSVEQLGDAFLTVGGLAKELNGGFITLSDGSTVAVDGIQELEIALTAMANAGVKGSEAGTHMRNMLMKLGTDGSKALKDIGVNVYDTEGNMKSLSVIFSDLNDKLSDMTQQEKLNVISKVFNARDTAAAEAMLAAVEQDWDAIGESILEAEGAAQKMADTQLDNLAGDVTLFNSALESAKINISDALTPTLREFVQFGTNGVSELATAFKEGGLSGAMEALGSILSEALNMAINMLPELIKAGGQLLKALGQGIIDNLPNIITTAITVGLSLIEGLISAIPMIIEAATTLISELVKGLSGNMDKIINGAIRIILVLSNSLLDNLPTIIEAAFQLIMAIVRGIIDNLPAIIGAGKKIIEKVFTTINENLPTLIMAGLDFIMAITQGIIDNLPFIIDAAMDIIDMLIDTVIQNIDIIIEMGFQVLTALIEGIIDNLPNIVMSTIQIITRITTTLLQNLPKILAMGVKIIVELIAGITKMVPQLIAKFPEMIKNMKEKFTSFDWKGLGKSIIEGIKNGITGAAKLITDAAKDAARKAYEGAKEFLGINSPSRLFRDGIGESIPEGMALGITRNAGLVEDAMDELSNTAAGSISMSLIEDNKMASNWSNAPLNTRRDDVAADTLEKMYMLCEKYFPEFSQDMVLDTGVLVASTAPAMSDRLGLIKSRRDRA